MQNNFHNFLTAKFRNEMQKLELKLPSNPLLYLHYLAEVRIPL